MKTGGDLIRGLRFVPASIYAALLAIGFGAGTSWAESGKSADTAASAMYESASPSATPGVSTSDSPVAPAATPSISASAEPNSSPAAASIPSSPLATAKTVVVPDSMPVPSYVKPPPINAQSTTEIPQVGPEPSQAGEAAPSGNEIVNYEKAQSSPLMQPPLHSLEEFMNEGDNMSPLGIEVREERRKLNSGEEADGLLIVGITGGSPAANAGLRAYRRTTRDVLEGAAVAAAMVFPPAVLAVPIFDQVHVGETYDLIIGVDGSRVTNFLDFEDRMRDVQPGEIVYLSIVRNGNRVQVPVPVPSTFPRPAF